MPCRHWKLQWPVYAFLFHLTPLKEQAHRQAERERGGKMLHDCLPLSLISGMSYYDYCMQSECRTNLSQARITAEAELPLAFIQTGDDLSCVACVCVCSFRWLILVCRLSLP